MKKLKKNFSKYNDAGPAFSSFPYMGRQEEIYIDNAHVSESSKRIPLNNKDGISTDRLKGLPSDRSSATDNAYSSFAKRSADIRRYDYLLGRHNMAPEPYLWYEREDWP